ncbi:MAG TPA: hypothetical protein VFM05_04360 [Candidatus Saccharimonadales bacterium]|nr:hypothetical protein [Candidatus Saccharimonadales bacterium]
MQETRICGWETWDDREEVKQIVRKQKALGQEFLDNYVKLRKKEMIKLARKKGCMRPELVEMRNRKRAMEAEAREQAAIRAQKKKLDDVISGLCLSESCLRYFVCSILHFVFCCFTDS